MGIRSKTLKTLGIICCLAAYHFCLGSHIVGGEASYEFIEFNSDSSAATYKVTFTIYRDQKGIQYEPFAEFGIYKMLPDNSWTTHTVVRDVPLAGVRQYSATNDPCNEQIISDIKVESGLYIFEATLPIHDNYYKIAYQKCCRNHTINNIRDAGITGAVYDIKISAEAQRVGNSSPKFKDYPPTFICTNEPLNYSHSAIDKDGDLLVYSFCTPYVSGGIESYEPQCCDCQNPESEFCAPPYGTVIYESGFTYDNPIGGSPKVTLDSSSGLITGTPNQNGAYVVAICVEEYRNGILLSQTRRDFEFNVVPCLKTLNASLLSEDIDTISKSAEKDLLYKFSECQDASILLENTSTDKNYIKDYSWEIIGPQQDTVLNLNQSNQENLNITFQDPGLYKGSMILNKTEFCSDTAYFEIHIKNNITPDFNFEFDPCDDSPVNFYNITEIDTSNVTQWHWDFGDGSSSDSFNAEHSYRNIGFYNVQLSYRDKDDCEYTYGYTLNWNPQLSNENPELIREEVIICPGDSIEFFGEWLFESGLYENSIQSVVSECDSVIHQLSLMLLDSPIEKIERTYICPGESFNFYGEDIDQAGHYNHKIQYKNAMCDSIIHNMIVEEADLPVIDLMQDTTLFINTDNPIDLQISGDYESIEWQPSLYLSCDDCKDPIVNLDAPMVYHVYVTNKHGCTVQKSISLEVDDQIRFFLPNVISSKETIKNNTKLFVQSHHTINYSYDMEIFDRFGNIIHKCHDAMCNDNSKGWTPQNINPGVFVYVINFTDDNYKESIVGTITVLE